MPGPVPTGPDVFLYPPAEWSQVAVYNDVAFGVPVPRGPHRRHQPWLTAQSSRPAHTRGCGRSDAPDRGFNLADSDLHRALEAISALGNVPAEMAPRVAVGTATMVPVPAAARRLTLRAVPYRRWANCGEGAMRVRIPVAGPLGVRQPARFDEED